MDKFVNLAQQGFDAYNKPQSHVNKTGGQEYNSPNYGGQGSYDDRPQFDHDEVVRHASNHASDSGNGDLFSKALGFINDNKKDHEKPLDDEEITRAHDKVYNQNDSSGLTSKLLGSAAALEVMKKFTGGGGSGGNSQTQLISMAMGEATKMFDKTGGGSSGNKQDAVNGAAMTIMKLLVQSKFSGSGVVGGSNSGGLSGLLSLASKFTK